MNFTLRKPHRAAAIAGAFAVAATALLAGAPAAQADEASASYMPLDTDRIGDVSSIVWSTNTGNAWQYVASAACPGATANDGIHTVARMVGDSKFTEIAANWGSYTKMYADPTQPVTVSGSTSLWQKAMADETTWVNFPQMVVYIECVPGGTTSAAVPGDVAPAAGHKFFSSTFQWKDTGGDNWAWVKVSGNGTRADTRTATTTSVTVSSIAADSAKLTATVSPSAAGTVTFKSGSTVLAADVPVSSGVAQTTVTGLVASTTYPVTATFTPTDSTAYAPSNGTASFNTIPAGGDGSNSSITVTVPKDSSPAAAGLKIEVKPSSSISLTGGARQVGQPWTATGSLGQVTVNDDRREASAGAWNLSGLVSNFLKDGDTANSSDSAKSIAASNLSWTPSKVSGPGAAGAASSDLSVASGLASGASSDQSNQRTVVNAGLSLAVPSAVVNGNYSATLTLTLI